MAQPLYYTFGNHMHWVDMEWLWGYHVLPGSVRDMIRLCREAGVKGCVNFDAIGYEKLAFEDPAAFIELREAVTAGMIEPVGCSYGQPYGLFHGGESNVRHLIYGARCVRNLLGVWPKTFWEEEFYFFPQLPQLLVGSGFTGASLFFQWTWHTPEIPREKSPVVWWEGIDGSRLLAATRNKLNLHQWPEDMDIVLGELSSSDGDGALVQQWLELMPSPDWMCRSELILPKLKELMADARFEIHPVTLNEYLSGIGVPPMASSGVSPEGHFSPEENHRRDADVTRHYEMHDVWHGLTLGRNGDRIRRESRQVEERIRTFEAFFSVLGLQGRPYRNWDVYPTWELEESWRKLLRSQHHDIDECEGLCAYPAVADRAWVWKMAEEWHAKANAQGHEGCTFQVFNPNSWDVDGYPALSWGPTKKLTKPEVAQKGDIATITCPGAYAEVNTTTGMMVHLSGTADGPNQLPEPIPLWPRWYEDGRIGVPTDIVCNVGHAIDVRCKVRGTPCQTSLTMPRSRRGLQIFMHLQMTPKIPGGYSGAYRIFFPCAHEGDVITDTPYAVHPLEGFSKGVRKYPEGDWMTSPQWFENVKDTFFASSLVDIPMGDRRLLVSQDSPRQWFKVEGGYEAVVASYDPWDEDTFDREVSPALDLLVHDEMTHAELWRTANTIPFLYAQLPPPDPSPIVCRNENVAVTAFYRETEDTAGRHLENYAGKDMGYPYVVRLVEFNGTATEVEIQVVEPLGKAFKTNLLGEIETVLEDLDSAPGYRTLRFPVRPREIVTLYLDLLAGRKQTRDLDAKREIWATVHRTSD